MDEVSWIGVLLGALVLIVVLGDLWLLNRLNRKEKNEP